MIRPRNWASRWLWSLLIVAICTVKLPAVTVRAADRELAGDVAGPADGDVVLPEQDLLDAVADDRPGGHAPRPGERRGGGGGSAPGRRGAAGTGGRGLQAQLRRRRARR